MQSYLEDKGVRALALIGFFGFAVGRVWQEAFAISGNFPAYNFIFYVFAFVALPIFLSRLSSIRECRLPPSGAYLFLAFLISVLVVIVFYSTDDFLVVNKADFGSMYFGYLISFFAYGILGFCGFVVSKVFSIRVAAWALFLCVTPILFIADWTSFSIIYKDWGSGRVVNYLLLGDMVVFVAGVYFAIASRVEASRFLAGSSFVIFVIVLFLNNSRSSLFAFLFASLAAGFFGGYFSASVRRTLVGVLFFIGTGFAVLSVWKLGDLVGFIESSRVLSLLLNAGVDGSLESRSVLFENGISRIIESPFLGDIGGQAKLDFGQAPLANYIHNFLSYWEQFGLAVFCLFVLAWGLLFKDSINYLHRYRSRGLVVVLMVIYSIVSLGFSRGFVHTIFACYFFFSFFSVYNRSLVKY